MHLTYFVHTRYILLHKSYILRTCTLHTSYMQATYFVQRTLHAYRLWQKTSDGGGRRRASVVLDSWSQQHAHRSYLSCISLFVSLSPLFFSPITTAVAAQIPSSSSSPYRGRAAGPLFGTSTLSSSNRRWCEARSPRDRSHSHLPKQTWTRSSLACASTARWTDPATS